MAKRKLPYNAFEEYVALGHGRSYALLAKKFGVSTRAVGYMAQREKWGARLVEAEAEAKAQADRELVSKLREMRTRHFKVLKAMTARAIEALQKQPLNSAMEGARVADMAIRLERAMVADALGEPEADVAQITREEVERLLTIDVEEDDEGPRDAELIEAGEDDAGGQDDAVQSEDLLAGEEPADDEDW